MNMYGFECNFNVKYKYSSVINPFSALNCFIDKSIMRHQIDLRCKLTAEEWVNFLRVMNSKGSRVEGALCKDCKHIILRRDWKLIGICPLSIYIYKYKNTPTHTRIRRNPPKM